MPHPKATTIFFAGTDTDVGKTYVASLAAAKWRGQGLRVGIYKPVASGCIVDQSGQRVAQDAVSLWNAAGRPRRLDDVCPQKFLPALAPPEAAALEGKSVDVSLLSNGLSGWRAEPFDVIIVEGAGGLMSPIADGVLNLDLIKTFQVDQVILVAANRLGVIHQVLATLSAAAHHGVPITGVVLSQPTPDSDASCRSNAQQIQRYTDVPVLGQVKHNALPEHADFLGEHPQHKQPESPNLITKP